jgi:hypothetical protein
LGIVVVLLFAAVALTLPHIQQGNFTPFALIIIGTQSALLQ